MPGRSPLKQPGVPSKETAAEHARRIAKTRAAYASMSRRGGALHGALRPGSAASARGAPKADPRPKEKHAPRTERSVDVLAALAYARGADRVRMTRESDESNGDDERPASLSPTTSLRSRPIPDPRSPDDPLTPSRAWFARSAREGRRAVSASESPEDMDAAMRSRSRSETAAAFAAARAKRARAAAAAAENAHPPNALAKTARQPASPNEPTSVPKSKRCEAVSISSTPALVPARAPAPPPPPPPRVARLGAATTGEINTERESASEPFRAFASAASPRRPRRGDDATARETGERGVGGSHSASSALVAARDALAAAAAANAELAEAAARTPEARERRRSRRSSDAGGDAGEPNPPSARDGSGRSRTEPGPGPGSEPQPEPANGPPLADRTRAWLGSRAPISRRPAALNFSTETRRAMDDGRAARAELLAAYRAVAARCASARTSSSPSSAPMSRAATERDARASESDSDDSAGLTPPPCERDSARRFSFGDAPVGAGTRRVAAPREGTGLGSLEPDVPGVESEVRLAARADSAHDGIVDDPLVHSSSLVSTRLAPERAAGEKAPAGTERGAAALTDAEIHGSSLVATRLAPGAAQDPEPASTRGKVPSAFATRAKSGAKGARPLLYVSPTCPHAHKAWLAALESGADFDVRFENLAAKSAALQDAFMAGTYEPEPLTAKVPVLVHEGRTMVESLLVAGYVARAFECEIEYASATEQYAGALFAAQFNALTPLYMQALKATSDLELVRVLDALRAQLRQCERALAIAQAHCADPGAAAGPFACGARYTLAEVTTSTMIPRLALVLGHYRGFRLHKEIEDAGLSRLAAWVDACVERPAFKTSVSRASEATGKDYGSALIDFSGKFVSWTGKA